MAKPGRPGEPVFRSAAFDDIPQPDFADVVLVSIPATDHPIIEDPAWWAERVFSLRSMPRWIALLLGLRQMLVRLIGVNRAPSSVFDVKSVVGEEALIAGDDSHLDFRAGVAVDVRQRLLRVTTVVRFHGWRGRLYFLPVGLLHDPITRAMARRAVRDFVREGKMRSDDRR
ncbi:MAG: DUF2867 domain-containing protein [Acidimicrobiia bacterium]